MKTEKFKGKQGFPSGADGGGLGYVETVDGQMANDEGQKCGALWQLRAVELEPPPSVLWNRGHPAQGGRVPRRPGTGS